MFFPLDKLSTHLFEFLFKEFDQVESIVCVSGSGISPEGSDTIALAASNQRLTCQATDTSCYVNRFYLLFLFLILNLLFICRERLMSCQAKTASSLWDAFQVAQTIQKVLHLLCQMNTSIKRFFFTSAQETIATVQIT